MRLAYGDHDSRRFLTRDLKSVSFSVCKSYPMWWKLLLSWISRKIISSCDQNNRFLHRMLC